MPATCSTCQRGRFEAFEILCRLTGELLEPTTRACARFVPLDEKTEKD